MATSTQQKMMGNWNQLRGMVKEHWGGLTDDDLQRVKGDFDQLVGLIQERTGEARQQIERSLGELSDQAVGMFAQASDSARQYADQASEAVRGAAQQVRDRSMEQYEQAQELFRRHPAESVAVAFGTGLVVGVIVGLIACSGD